MTQADEQLHQQLAEIYQKLDERFRRQGVWLVLEGDYGGQIYLTIPWQMIGEKAEICTLLEKMDQLAWAGNEGEGASAYLYAPAEAKLTKEDGVGGGMGGGELHLDLWMHNEFHGQPQFPDHPLQQDVDVLRGASCEEVKAMNWGSQARLLLDTPRN